MIDHSTVLLYSIKLLCPADALGRPCHCARCVAIEACRAIVELRQQLRAAREAR